MSFSTEVKNELARVTGEHDCCYAAELAALIRMGGAMSIGGNSNLGINFSSENAAVARKVLSLIKRHSDIKTEVVVTRGRRLKKNNTYHVRVIPSPGVNQLLASLGIMRGDSLNVQSDSGILRKACCRRAYLRGAFLGGGSVNRPEGSYHLELVTGNAELAKSLVKIMRSLSLPGRQTERKDDYIVYLKDGNAITAFLQIIGAHNALLTFENVRVVKDMRNQVNRLVNCETANLQKTVNAAVRQVESIRLIERTIGLDKLPPPLREVAEARLAYPEATLSELVEALEGRVGKSGINHRLRKLGELAQELGAGSC
ncbi:putative cell division protein WhiA [Sporomusa carbonis]|uniref:DNA-binding protein WhiA n=1 Tax=Sporomusa carbonis TaxID=3076075 RepID=UPI003A63E35E